MPIHGVPPCRPFPRTGTALGLDGIACRHRWRERPKLLNLFAYTGAASLVAAAAGYEVTHVDASKKAIAWAKESQCRLRLDAGSRPLDLRRRDEVRRARGAAEATVTTASSSTRPSSGEALANGTWRIEEGLMPMLADCARLLADGPSFLMLTAYAIRMSALSLLETARDALGLAAVLSRPANWSWRSRTESGICRRRFTCAGRAMERHLERTSRARDREPDQSPDQGHPGPSHAQGPRRPASSSRKVRVRYAKHWTMAWCPICLPIAPISETSLRSPACEGCG
jgi:hypothetical protein